MAKFNDRRSKPGSHSSDPVAEVMELFHLMLAECPFPVVANDRRETIDRRLYNTVRAIPRGEDRRASR